MVTGLDSLFNSENSMMLKLLNDVSSLEAYQKTEEKKESEGASVEEVFSQILDEINEQTEQAIEEQSGIEASTETADNSNENTQFGPPPWLKIEGLEELMMN